MTSFVWVQHCVFMVSIVTGECAILILQKLLFLGLCEIIWVLLNKVIIVTSFVQGQYCVFLIDIVMGECNILIQKNYGLVFVIAAIFY